MATLNIIKRRVIADYDDNSDVLYVTNQPAIADEGEDDPHGIILRYSMDDNVPTGATIVGFDHNHWVDRLALLSKIIANHLGYSETYVEEIIINALPVRPTFIRGEVIR